MLYDIVYVSDTGLYDLFEDYDALLLSIQTDEEIVRENYKLILDASLKLERDSSKKVIDVNDYTF